MQRMLLKEVTVGEYLQEQTSTIVEIPIKKIFLHNGHEYAVHRPWLGFLNGGKGGLSAKWWHVSHLKTGKRVSAVGFAIIATAIAVTREMLDLATPEEVDKAVARHKVLNP